MCFCGLADSHVISPFLFLSLPPSFLSRSIRSIHHSQKVLSMIIVALRFRSACNSCPVLVLSLSRTGITIWKGLLCFCSSALPWICLSTLFFSFLFLPVTKYLCYLFLHRAPLRPPPFVHRVSVHQMSFFPFAPSFFFVSFLPAAPAVFSTLV